MTHPRCSRPAISEQTRVALEELAARVEKAEGPDRELDFDILRATSSTFDADWHDWQKYRGKPIWVSMRDNHPTDPVLPYTASIDAAMTLVPDGWDKGMQDMGEDGSFAEVWRHGWHDDTVVLSEARTPALALVAASLRARAAVGEG